MNPQKDITELIDHIGDICISIFMPTHPAQRQEQQADAIRLRNLVTEARTQLHRFSPSLRCPDVEQLLQPANHLWQGNGDFWKYQQGGLAIFLGTDFSRIYQLPLAVEPLVVVSGRFYIRPLLPLLVEDGRFYLLALSQNQVRFYQATTHTLTEITIPHIPANLEAILAYDQPEKQLQFRGAGGTHSPIFYSVDIPNNYKKESLLRYCQQIDAGLQSHLRQSHAPLVLACVDYLFAIYQQANSYPHLLPHWAAGSPDRLNESTLHAKAWAVVQPIKQQAQQERLAQLAPQLGHSQALTDVAQIVTAAFHGRVQALFTAVSSQHWGFFNQSTGEVFLQEYATPHSQDLLNLAAIYTLSNSGQVYTVQSDDLPEGIQVAAQLRY